MSVDEFRAQFADAAGIEAPETPVEETDTVAVEEEPVVEEQPKAEAPEDVVEEVAAEEVVVDEDAEALAAYLAKYGGDTDAALRAAVEAQKIIGRQSAEVSEARKIEAQVAELRALVEQQNVTPATPVYDPGSIDEYLVENPQQIPALAQQAIDTEDGYLYSRALAAWSEHDQVGAMDFHARKVSEANMAQLREEMRPALQQVERTSTSNQFAEAYKVAASSHEDFAQVMNSITDETIAGFPRAVLEVLKTGDQASKEEVLETLYRWTKAEQAGNLTQAATAVARQAQQDSRTARTEAAVATTTTSQNREAVSGTDAWREELRNSDAFRRAAGLV